MKHFFISFLCLLFIFVSGCSFFKTSLDSTEIEEEYGEEEDIEEESADQEDEEQMEQQDEEDVVLIDEEDLPAEGDEVAIEEFSEEDDFVAGFEDVDEDEIMEDSVPLIADSNVSSSATPPVAKKTWIPLKKIKTTPYNKAGFLVNAVYIARSQDTIETVSNQIFNSDNTQQLYAINPHLRNRNLKVGDKIYYNSPRRPNDNSQVLFYFEDIGATSQEHFVQAGENIRVVSSNLLGHKDSWKEIWATNLNIDSKGILNQSVSIKYWTEVTSVEPVSSPPPVEEDVSSADSSPETGEEVSQQNDEISSGEEIENIGANEELTEAEIAPGLISENEPPQSSGIIGLIKKEGMLATAVIVALIGFIFVPAILKRRKKKEYDFTAANFEVD